MTYHFKTLAAALLATTISSVAVAQAVGTDGGADATAPAYGTDSADVGASGAATGTVLPGDDAGIESGASDYAATPGAAAEGDAAIDSGAADFAMGADATVEDSAMDYSLFLASVHSAADIESELSGINDDFAVNTVYLSDIEEHAAEASLDNALEEQEDRIADLRSEIEAHEELSAALEEEGYSAEDVVAISASLEGDEVTVFIDDRS